MREFRFALATLAATFLLLLVGGLVHPTGSSLACPDWPLCFGQVFPKMEGGVLYEHSHRLAATAVGLLTIVLVLLLHKRAPLDRRLSRLGWAALGLVVFQGVLGGITVLLKLPLLVSTTHLATSMLFFSLLGVIVFESRPEEAPRPAPAPPVASFAPLAFFSAALVYVQIVLGAFVRHTGSGLACNTTILTCDGALWPSGPETGPAKVQMAHRILAVVVGVVVTLVAVALRRRALEAGRPTLARWAAVAPLLVLVQIGLGILTVKSFIHLGAVEAHLGVGALLLLHQIGLWLACRRERTTIPAPAVDSAATPAGSRAGFAALVRDLAELAKPRVTALVVFTTAPGLWIAPGKIGPLRAAIVLAATALVVASANTLNCWMERDVDGLMLRTRRRPLPAGRLSAEAALVFGLVLAACSIPALLVATNGITALLGLIALVTYVLVYTPLKRISPVALVIGSIPGAIPPLMGWTAVTGRIDAPALVLFGILFVWQIPHFIAISLYLKDDYARGGLRVLPIVRGDDVARKHLLAWTVALVPVSILMVPLGVAGTAYLLTALALGAGFLWFALQGLRASAGVRWARQTFAFSLVYLTVLVGVLVAVAR